MKLSNNNSLTWSFVHWNKKKLPLEFLDSLTCFILRKETLGGLEFWNSMKYVHLLFLFKFSNPLNENSKSSVHATRHRRISVKWTSWSYIDVIATLFKRHVPARHALICTTVYETPAKLLQFLPDIRQSRFCQLICILFSSYDSEFASHEYFSNSHRLYDQVLDSNISVYTTSWQGSSLNIRRSELLYIYIIYIVFRICFSFFFLSFFLNIMPYARVDFRYIGKLRCQTNVGILTEKKIKSKNMTVSDKEW